MDSNKIDVLLKTLKIGSMKQAAHEFNYTQSGLLYMINSLEDELGLSILNRSRRGITLNEKGMALLPYLESFVDSDARLKQQVDNLSKASHSLHIGVQPSVASSVFPGILKRYIQKHPDVSIVVHVAFNDMSRLLDLGKIDLAIFPQLASEKYSYHHLINTQFCAAFHKDSIPEDMESVTIEEFEEHPIILSSNNPENAVFLTLTQRSLQHDLKCYALDGTPLLAMVAQNLGATFCSELYRSECPENVRMLPFSPAYEYEIGAVIKSVDENNSLLTDFIREAQLYCKSVGLYKTK